MGLQISRVGSLDFLDLKVNGSPDITVFDMSHPSNFGIYHIGEKHIIDFLGRLDVDVLAALHNWKIISVKHIYLAPILFCCYWLF